MTLHILSADYMSYKVQMLLESRAVTYIYTCDVTKIYNVILHCSCCSVMMSNTALLRSVMARHAHFW